MKKWLFALLSFCYLTLLQAQTNPFTPPPNPLPPPFMAGLLPIVLVNDSTLPDSQVNILITGRVPGMPTVQAFVSFDAAGVGTLIPAIAGDNGSNHTRTLAQLPVTTSGRVVYIPNIDSAAIFFSLNQPLDIPVNASNQIVQPNFTSPADPNFNTIFDIFEFAFLSTGTNISANATAVSFFSLPLYGFISTPDPGSASNTGLFEPRDFILAEAASLFGIAPEASQWENLILRNGTTILRILSPGKAMTATPPFMDPNYLDNAAAYGYSYINDIWTSPTSFYRLNPLRLTIPAGSFETYTGVINPDNTITFTSFPSGFTVIFSAPTTTPLTTTQEIFSGIPLDVFDNSPGMQDGVQISKLFEEAIIAGLVPTPNTLSNAYLLANQSQFYNINPNLSPLGKVTGPWYDLYSKALHSLGFIYTFAFDEPLWPQVQITSSLLIPNATYLGITIGPLTSGTPTTTTLTSSMNPAIVGQVVTFTATVTGVSGTPTGSVTFSIDGVLGSPVPLVNGQATFSTSSLSVGTHEIAALYSGDTTHLPSSADILIIEIIMENQITPLPPRDLEVFQVENQFATQTDIVNILTWKAPLSGSTPVLYKIYRDRHLTKLIAKVPAKESSSLHETFRYKDHNRKENRTYRYFIVSIDASGNISSPAEAIFHGKRRESESR